MGQKNPKFGFCTWHVCENMIVGDEVFAGIYGFSIEQASSGVAIELVLAKIAAGDRERVAKEVHEAILDGEFYSTSYLVENETGTRTVTYIGRCLRDREGLPSVFSGTISEQFASHLLSEKAISAHHRSVARFGNDNHRLQ